MIDVDLAIEAIKKKLNSMPDEKRKEYLRDLGIVFEENFITQNNIFNEIAHLEVDWLNTVDSMDIQFKIIAELLPILGYRNFCVVGENQNLRKTQKEHLEKNAKIIECIYPRISFNKMVDLFDTIEEKIFFLGEIRSLFDKYNISINRNQKKLK